MSEIESVHEHEEKGFSVPQEFNWAIHALQFVTDRRRFPAFLRWLRSEGCVSFGPEVKTEDVRKAGEWAMYRISDVAREAANFQAMMQRMMSEVVEEETGEKDRGPYL